MILGNLGYEFFFEQIMINFFFFFLKMNEPWANASSLDHEFMSLEKLDLINFENNDASDDFFFF